MSSHFHLLVSVDDANQLARFMEYVDSNLAREVKRLHDWPEHVWGRRYQAILVSEAPIRAGTRRTGPSPS